MLGHPVAGFSREGIVIENILRAAPEHTEASFQIEAMDLAHLLTDLKAH